MSEITDAVQIIKLSFDMGAAPVKVAFKVATATPQMIYKIGCLIQYMNRREWQNKGSVTLDNLLKQGDQQIFKFPTKKMDEVKKLAKKYGVMYREMPDLNDADQMTEIMFPAKQAMQMNAIISRLKVGEITGIDEYINNAEPGKMESLTKDAEAMIKAAGKNDLPADGKEEQYQRMADRLEINNKLSDKSLSPITIDRKLIVSENETAIKTRIPNQMNKFVMIPKQGSYMLDMSDQENKTILSFLKNDSDYEIVDRNDHTVEQVRGKALYDNNYSVIKHDLPAMVKKRNIHKIPDKVLERNSL